jgi:hypothetical protein
MSPLIFFVSFRDSSTVLVKNRNVAWLDSVLNENVLWLKYVIRLPRVLIINRLRLQILAGEKAYRMCGAKLALFPDASNA